MCCAGRRFQALKCLPQEKEKRGEEGKKKRHQQLFESGLMFWPALLQYSQFSLSLISCIYKSYLLNHWLFKMK